MNCAICRQTRVFSQEKSGAVRGDKAEVTFAKALKKHFDEDKSGTRPVEAGSQAGGSRAERQIRQMPEAQGVSGDLSDMDLMETATCPRRSALHERVDDSGAAGTTRGEAPPQEG